MELPNAVERHVLLVDGFRPGSCVIRSVGKHIGFGSIGHVSRNCHFLVDTKDSFVLPNGRLNLGLFYLLKGKPRRLIGCIIICEHHLSILEGIHCFTVLTLNAGRENAVRTRHFGNGLELPTGIVPHTFLRCPLNELLDAHVVATVVEVLRIERTTHHALLQVEHLNAPILTAVHLIHRLTHDARIVFAAIAVTKHEFGIRHTANEVRQVVVKTRNHRGLDAKHRLAVALCLCLVGKGELAVIAQDHCLCRLVTGNEVNETVGSRFCAPQLEFVRTVVLTHLHATIVCAAHSKVAEGVNNAPTAGQFSNCPLLFCDRWVRLSELDVTALRVGQHLSCLRSRFHIVKATLHIVLRHCHAHRNHCKQCHHHEALDSIK